MKKQKAIVNCENVKLYCLPKWYINCIIQSNKRRRELMNKVKDSNQNIAKAVLKIRQDNKLSQEQFAEMVGVTRQAVSRWEISIPFVMSADDHNCTSHFGVDAFCLALHGADLHIQSGAWSTKHGNCSAWRGCDYYLFPAEWCDFAGYSFLD